MASSDVEGTLAAHASVEHVDFSYGSVQVLFDVTMQVQRGETLALLGTNGAGKSTLLRVLCGLERPDRGRVHVEGQDVTSTSVVERVKQGIALVPGGKAVFPDLSVNDNLAVAAYSLRRQRAVLEERLDHVLSLFPALRQLMETPAQRLSGGEQQQLALAKAFLLDPPLLCIDELSLGLAPTVVTQLLDAVRSMSQRGTTVVLVEQSLNIAASLCERAVFMEKGAIRFEGRTSDLLERSDIARAVFLGGHAGDAMEDQSPSANAAPRNGRRP